VWRADATGLLVAVKVQPKSRRPGVGGQSPSADGPRLRVNVTEAPEDGRASRAACAALAAALGLKPAAVSLVSGASSREKTLHVAGSADSLAAVLDALADA
jgi:uncharacterized protein YggU (UPF0235/DUF167 family)